ncbi:MAG: hypothetical protein B7X07_07515, partial [Actinobacteria bacterium 21-64-8]
MRAFLHNTHLRRFAITFLVVELVALMTGPPGSTQAPTSGFRGSFFEASSFYGLFRTQRWIVFLALAIVLYAIGSLWNAKGTAVRGGVTKVLASPRSLSRRPPVRWSFLAAIGVLAILLPHIVTDPFWDAAMTEQIGVYVLLATGLNVVVGFAGLLDLGYVAFYAIGAYTTAWMTGSLPTPAPFHGHFDPFVAIP